MKATILLLTILIGGTQGWSSDKIQLELLTQTKPFQMRVGEAQEIKFDAVTNRQDLKYIIFLRHADSPPWHNDEGPLAPEALPLKHNVNTFRWDGESFARDFDDGPKMGKLKKGASGKYYFMIYILDSNKPIRLLGKLSNWHKSVITKIRSKTFTLK